MKSLFAIILLLCGFLTKFTFAENTQSNETCNDNTMTDVTTTLVVGATGATGRHVVQMLLDRGQKVRTVVRSKERLNAILTGNDFGDRLEVTEAALLDLPQSKLEELTLGCDAIVSCLGHNLDWKGIWGQPRRLVTDAVNRLTSAVGPKQKTKFILMGSNGVVNPSGTDDKRPFGERVLLCILRCLVPPHVDNEQAALALHELGGQTSIEWSVVRPDDLIDGEVSNYELLSKPKAGLFGAGKATRSNVAHSMVELILDDSEWQKWKFQMPVLNNDVGEA